MKFYWCLFSHISTEYGNSHNKSPYSVRMRKNTEQRNSNTDSFNEVIVTLMTPSRFCFNVDHFIFTETVGLQ